MPRSALYVLCLLCPAVLAGCLLPFAVPKYSYTPTVKLEPIPADVRAFRVNVDREDGREHITKETLAAVPITADGAIATQSRFSVSYGCALFLYTAVGNVDCDHTVSVRLYRPGYELVEIESWTRAAPVKWIPAADVDAQEKALDALIPAKRQVAAFGLPGHREALLFGVSEYERLMALSKSDEQRQRMLTAAIALRDLAQK